MPPLLTYSMNKDWPEAYLLSIKKKIALNMPQKSFQFIKNCLSI